VTIQVSDSTGTVQASWFYGKTTRFTLERYKSRFKKGASIILSGKVKRDEYSGQLIIDKPQEQVLSGDFDESQSPNSLHLGRIVPVYPLSENLHIKTLRNAIFNALEKYAGNLDEVLPDYIVKEFDLMPKNIAIRQIHFPDSQEYLDEARRRLIFEELFLIQLKLAYLRHINKISQEGNIIGIKEDGVIRQFIESLPFELTSAQNNAFNEILQDLQDKTPMQRLLQGDVGSGKTVVACLAILSAIENNFQTALMAPTEILAEQHYKNFVNWLTPLGLSVGLFVGKHGVRIRKEMNQNLKNGQIHLAIGTHALIQEGVEFNNLGLVVIVNNTDSG
jgi:ATP-dependent DNA helicase RecG